MNTLKPSSAIPLAFAAFAALASAAARAEYRCATPGLLTQGEVRACQLAREETPAALIHFVNRTKGIYGLYVNDYVSHADVERYYEVVRRKNEPVPPAVAKMGRSTKGDTD